MNREHKCINCAAYDGVEGGGSCAILGYIWAVSNKLAIKNDMGLFFVPLEINDLPDDDEIMASMRVDVFAGNHCKHFREADDECFCNKCGNRLAGMYPNYCHNCGEEVERLQEDADTW